MHRFIDLEDDNSFEEELERDLERLRWARREAEELVLARGWSKEDDDFEIQVEEEAKRQWEEDFEREMRRKVRWEEMS